MKNIATMKLEDYDEMKDQIRDLKKEVQDLKDNRIKELKEKFELDSGYGRVGIFVNATELIKELYGEELKLTDKTYDLIEEEIHLKAYSVWTERKVEEDETKTETN